MLKTSTPDIKKRPIPLNEASWSSLKQIFSIPRMAINMTIFISTGHVLPLNKSDQLLTNTAKAGRVQAKIMTPGAQRDCQSCIV